MWAQTFDTQILTVRDATSLSPLFTHTQSTDKRSALRIVREAELLGGVLSSSLTKEHLLLTAEFLRGDE